MSLIKATKIPTTAEIMGPLTKTLSRLKAANGARKEHIGLNNDQIKTLQSQNSAHQTEIDNANGFIEGFEKTFGIK